MKARYPDIEGDVIRDGVRLHYRVYGHGAPTLLFMPSWSIVHSEVWKAQVAYFARHGRVVTFDGRGNGRSDRPADPAAYTHDHFVADALAVLDATDTARAVVVGLSRGGHWALQLVAQHPERALGVVAIGPSAQCGPFPEWAMRVPFTRPLDSAEGWDKYNLHHWRRDYPDFAAFFVRNVFPEPHSTKQIEDAVGWAGETDGETLIATQFGAGRPDLEAAAALYASITCPTLVIHGDQDRIAPVEAGARVAELTGGSLVVLEGAGHAPQARDPVKVNQLIGDFVERLGPPRVRRTTWARAFGRTPRALYLSSPIGLGHVRRDLAIADELRALRPDLELDWLAQSPVTEVLAEHGERVHAASRHLANESAHLASEACEHDLHCFHAYRSMDEILLANFLVFQEVVEAGCYDLVLCDEAWDVDYFWHENPELKRAAHVWMTDFVGFLPMPEGGAAEAALAADYNADMVERVARYRRVRDLSLFVGDPDDIVPAALGPGLPTIRAWTEQRFQFSGYITGFDPAALARDALRHELGFRPDEKVCVVTVGGSGVGAALLRRIIAALPAARRALPELRMIAVAGPRIDPDSLPRCEGLEVRAYVPRLYRLLAACDVAVVQGGLTTTMELTAAGRPFLYFPLRHHFEQTFHVAHRLDRHRAGRRMDFATATPEVIAEALVAELRRPLDYLPVPADGARRAARAIAELL